MSALLEKLAKNSTIKESDILSDSKFFQAKDFIQTSIPALNIALSGSVVGGLTPGLTVWAGQSKHFKSSFTLMMVKAYLDKYADGVVLFYDSEFGSPQSYFDSFGIDTKKVLHCPVTDIEQLKHDTMKQFESISRGDHVIVVIDSVGNLASKKEVEDAIEGKSVADMSRAKQLKSYFRMVTPHLNLKDIPMVVVNHTYKEIGLYPKDIVSGGTGIYYSADSIFIIGRQQEKDGTEVTGYRFIINVEKSRYVREKSKIPVEVSFEGGISRWSGLLEIAMDGGFVTKPNVGWYSKKGETQKYREKDTNTKEFWLPILQDVEFRTFVENKFRLSNNSMDSQVTDTDIGAEYDNAK